MVFKKQLTSGINQHIDQIMKNEDGSLYELNYKNVVSGLAKSCDKTVYEVLNCMESMEKDGLVRFYPLSKNTQGVGIVSETYRLKVEEAFDIKETDYVESFINEALILDMCQ